VAEQPVSYQASRSRDLEPHLGHLFYRHGLAAHEGGLVPRTTETPSTTADNETAPRPATQIPAELRELDNEAPAIAPNLQHGP
jgi:hypothetical protein